MDHMMPGMDGIETTAAIRSLGIKDTPVVALTANAVSGRRDVFIEKGFNDYISKPIEITELDSIIAKWIPPEKRMETGKPLERGSAESTELVIAGIDTVKGIAMTGGTEAGYRKVLAQFYKDAAERLPVFVAIPTEGGDGDNDQSPERNLSAFATQAHAIKSAAGTIGAAEVSAEAAKLEAAGKAGDVETIRKILPLFHENLARLIEAIEKELRVKSEEKKAPLTSLPALHTPLSFHTSLSALRSALETKNMKEIDRLLEEIEQLPLDTATRELINTVSDKVLMGEYQGAIENVTILLEAKER
jgi:CheY-like chemotaxis protein